MVCNSYSDYLHKLLTLGVGLIKGDQLHILCVDGLDINELVSQATAISGNRPYVDTLIIEELETEFKSTGKLASVGKLATKLCAYHRQGVCFLKLNQSCLRQLSELVYLAFIDALKPFKKLTQAGKVVSCSAVIASKAWANKLKLSEVELAAELGEITRNYQSDLAKIEALVRCLNQSTIDSLHFRSSTCDLRVQLPANAPFIGGRQICQGVERRKYLPNFPTFECFTAPLKYGVEGNVLTQRPFCYAGAEFAPCNLSFKAGKAESDYVPLNNLLADRLDRAYLGEIAIVLAQRIKRVYYDTLLDENAGCHFALGASYPLTYTPCLQGKSEAELSQFYNQSDLHLDICFGTPDLQIDLLSKGCLQQTISMV